MRVLSLFVLLLSFQALATDVEGTITYTLPNGDLVDREVTLNVPARGQGEVVLSGKSFEWRTKNFRSYEVAGKTTFIAAFNEEFRGKKFVTLLKGTYVKGNNRIIYVGDVFKGKNKKFQHSGVFRFEYLR